MSGIIVFIRSVGTAHTGYPVRISAIAEPIPPASAPPVRINKRLLKSHCRQDVHIPVESVSESAWLRYRSVPYTPPSYKNPSYSDGYFLFLLHLYYYSYYCPFLPVIHLHNRITDIGLFVNTHFSFIFYSQIVAALWSVLYQRLFFCNHDTDENAF